MTETHAPRTRARVLDDLRSPCPAGRDAIPYGRLSRHTPPTIMPRSCAPRVDPRPPRGPTRPDARERDASSPGLQLELVAALAVFTLAFAVTLTRQDLDAALMVLTFAILTAIAFVVLRAEADETSHAPGHRHAQLDDSRR
ncbi:MAG: hypothetical protein KC486_25585 [Myxococcales bacterium]|nr:hypothetical protein [Myxococcales bacterium]